MYTNVQNRRREPNNDVDDFIVTDNVVNNNRRQNKKRNANQMQSQSQVCNGYTIILRHKINGYLARRFLLQASDPAFTCNWTQIIMPMALTMIQLRLRNEVYRSIVPLQDIDTWPLRSNGSEPKLLHIASVIMKLYGSKLSSDSKTIEEQCRDHPFKYEINSEIVEENFLIGYMSLVDNYYSGIEIDPDQDALLARILYEKLPQGTPLYSDFLIKTNYDLLDGPETVKRACFRVKDVLASFREIVRKANSFCPPDYDYNYESDNSDN